MEPKRAKIFLKYLANASRNVHQQQSVAYVPKKTVHHSPAIIERRPSYIKKSLRMPSFEKTRRHELEVKVNKYFVDRRYDPYEEKIDDLRKELRKLKKNKKADKSKLRSLDHRLKKCKDMLKEIKKERY